MINKRQCGNGQKQNVFGNSCLEKRYLESRNVIANEFKKKHPILSRGIESSFVKRIITLEVWKYVCLVYKLQMSAVLHSRLKKNNNLPLNYKRN